ncbi:MAG: hypothetical protein JWR76_1520 [Mucilaginibacter sp.]|nr:hypothetical protein [Mucilaginibacter sp.]
MLTNAILKAFVPTVKPDEARVFYGNILGFKPLSEEIMLWNLMQAEHCYV